MRRRLHFDWGGAVTEGGVCASGFLGGNWLGSSRGTGGCRWHMGRVVFQPALPAVCLALFKKLAVIGFDGNLGHGRVLQA